MLNLTGNALGMHAPGMASELVTLTALTDLQLAQNAMHDVGAVAFAKATQHMPKLAKLQMQQNRIGDQGLKEMLAYLCHLDGLRELGLGLNVITDAGVECLNEYSWLLARLERLDLSKCPVRHACLAELSADYNS